jgi:hypothetical protein
MRPIILVGESKQEKGMASDDLEERMRTILSGCNETEFARAVMV